MSKIQKLGDVLNGAPIPNNEGIYPAYGGNGIIKFVNKYNYLENTIIIGRVGANCGVVNFSSTKCWVTDNALAFTVKNGNPYFVYLLLKMLNLNKFHIGSSQPLITQNIINQIEYDFTEDLVIQNKIAQIIKCIDDKIENNNKISNIIRILVSLLIFLFLSSISSSFCSLWSCSSFGSSFLSIFAPPKLL